MADGIRHRDIRKPGDDLEHLSRCPGLEELERGYRADRHRPGEEALRSQLIDVRENAWFIDETRVGDLAIKVAHRIEPLGPARTRIVYAVDAQGPQAAEIGPAVSADFPEVLASLAKLVEARSGA